MTPTSPTPQRPFSGASLPDLAKPSNAVSDTSSSAASGFEKDPALVFRPVWSVIDLSAVRANVATMVNMVAPSAVMAVVKADAYGHGAVPVAFAALDAGAQWLGVALVEEGVALRDAGVNAPIMLLSEPALAAAPTVIAHDLTPVVYTDGCIDALAKAMAECGRVTPLDVHLKVDTGMHRVGCRPGHALELAGRINEEPGLRLAGLCTHLAVADEVNNDFTAEQLAHFNSVLAAFAESGVNPGIVHAANSAAALAYPESRYDLVRVGIAVYGIAPAEELAKVLPLAPVLSMKASVSHVQRLEAGQRISYGLRYELGSASNIATVPVGYADGIPRKLGAAGGEVLVGGVRRQIAGTVTMDQLMVDMGDDDVAVGDEVVLLGRQGREEITAVEWARRVETIPYEIVCQIGPRVPRRYV